MTSLPRLRTAFACEAAIRLRRIRPVWRQGHARARAWLFVAYGAASASPLLLAPARGLLARESVWPAPAVTARTRASRRRRGQGPWARAISGPESGFPRWL